MQQDEGVDLPDAPGAAPRPDDGLVIVDFSIGPSGVGPVVGLDSGEFYPAVTQTAADDDLAVPKNSG